MNDIFNKGTLLSLKVKKNSESWFVVAVTGKEKNPDDFKGIVVACGKQSPWEIGHKCSQWAKTDWSWEIVEIPQSLLTKSE